MYHIRVLKQIANFIQKVFNTLLKTLLKKIDKKSFQQTFNRFST